MKPLVLIHVRITKYKNKRIYLTVQYKDKDTVKGLGGKWDPIHKKWYIYENNNHMKDIVDKYSPTFELPP